ncbi:KH domain-containing protein [Lujinxingia vulgaris]|uniref:RNA-binding protein KhpA n=1 Tax=Lujinxingia vulgaris TaxID=2600176 RepID=A0A5C6WYS4_9DELT|nr:KH domain-containing protein [Lujinxingia vulgaris]TXD34603.1 KH domain-containing protein [Lujinxingia vulgaris]
MSNHTAEDALKSYEELVRFLAGSLLDDDVEFEVRAHAHRDQLLVELAVEEAHRGRVIGRGGRIARAMRTLVDAAAVPNHLPVVIDIVD